MTQSQGLEDALSARVAALAGSPIGDLVPIAGGPFSGQLAYLPKPLPKELPLSADLVCLLEEASLAVGTLVGVGETLPNPNLLASPLLRREAVLSSRIEGTQASISDLFVYEASGQKRPRGDVAEVYNYIAALHRGLQLLETLPISMRLMNGVHETLMRGNVRGHERNPGQLRSDQVWIGADGTGFGEARFVPPPAAEVRRLIEDWERFSNEEGLPIPPLVQCGVLHYQIETIHPYWDGNGRVGRLMVILFLHAKGILQTPLLYLSPYFERNRDEYYDHLYRVSQTGEWEPWLAYFLEGVKVQAGDTLTRARRLRGVRDDYHKALQEGGGTANDLKIVEHLMAAPVISTPTAVDVLDVTRQGARGVLERLTDVGILRELPGHWPRTFVADAVLDALQDP